MASRSRNLGERLSAELLGFAICYRTGSSFEIDCRLKNWAKTQRKGGEPKLVSSGSEKA